MEVCAARTILAAPEAVFEFLSEPDRHWQLLGRRLESLSAYDGGSSRVRLHGPLGVRRTIAIRLVVATPPSELLGRVEVPGGRTVGSVRWAIQAVSESSCAVELSARTAVAGSLDRLLLTCGGTRWLARSLAVALATLAELAERAELAPPAALSTPAERARAERARSEPAAPERARSEPAAPER